MAARGYAMWRYLAAWLPMVAIAIANGLLREAAYGPYVGALAAHQISTATALLLLGIYMRTVIRAWPPGSPARARAVGLMWLALTLGFEWLFGHYVARHPWIDLLRDCDLAAGRVWVFVPIWVAVAPSLFNRGAPTR